MAYNEEDTRLHLITPRFAAYWLTRPRITIEYRITPGQNVFQGGSHRTESDALLSVLLDTAFRGEP